MSQERRSRTEAAARLLEDLLQRPAYRQRWLGRVRRGRDRAEINQAAVADVVASYLWDSGERPDTDHGLARRLRDRIRRALTGEVLSPETVTWFAAAFGMTEADEQALWTAYFGEAGDGQGVAGTIRTVRAAVRPQRHRTLALFERFTLGADRQIAGRQTQHVITAVAEGLQTYLFEHEADVLETVVKQGGRWSGRFEYGDGLTADEITLDRPLRRRQTSSLEYLARYAHREQDVTEVRRLARARTENLDLAVEFDPAARPARAWWCVWDDFLGGAPVVQEAVAPAQVLHRFVPYVENTAVGFRWTW